MNKELLIKETVTYLNKLSIDDVYLIRELVNNFSLRAKLDMNEKSEEFKFEWLGALKEENIDSVKLQKEALNWR
jgi:MinD superfamily P-loop ATPase